MATETPRRVLTICQYDGAPANCEGCYQQIFAGTTVWQVINLVHHPYAHRSCGRRMISEGTATEQQECAEAALASRGEGIP